MVRKSDKDAIIGIVKLSGFNPCLNVMIADPNDIRVTGIMRKQLGDKSNLLTGEEQANGVMAHPSLRRCKL